MRRVLSLLLAVGLGTWLSASVAGCSRQGEGERCDTRNSAGTGALGGDCEDHLECTASGICCPPGKTSCGVSEKTDTGTAETPADTGRIDTGSADTGSSDTTVEAGDAKTDTSETSDDAPADSSADTTTATDAADAG